MGWSTSLSCQLLVRSCPQLINVTSVPWQMCLTTQTAHHRAACFFKGIEKLQQDVYNFMHIILYMSSLCHILLVRNEGNYSRTRASGGRSYRVGYNMGKKNGKLTLVKVTSPSFDSLHYLLLCLLFRVW